MALPSSLDAILAHHLPRPESSPGVQVAIVSADAVIYEAANGLADAVGKPPLPPFNLGPLTTSHQANLYSASKLFAACCALRLIETGKISGPECDVRDLLPPGVRDRVPQGQCTVERLVTHTSGAPNPLPLSWVHCPGDEVDEASLLGEILRRHPFKEGRGGGPRPYAYSNVGYWILGMAVTSALGADPSDFGRCCQELLFAPGAGEGFLTLQEGELLVSDDFDPRAPMMSGHVKAWSVLSLAARLFCPPGTMGPSNAAGWVRTEPHLPDGASYGGLVGSARSIGMFLRRLLRGDVLSEESLEMLFFAPGQSDMMTFGLHVRPHLGVPTYHKEGGGGGLPRHSTVPSPAGAGRCLHLWISAFRRGRHHERFARPCGARQV